jgi:hypothetical protein
VFSVEFFVEKKVPCCAGPTSIGTDFTDPYEAVFAPPGFATETYDATAKATDNCGLTTTSAPFTFSTGCGELPGEAQSFHWSSQLEAAGSAGRVSLNGAMLASGPGRQEGVAQTKRNQNRVDGELVQGASRPGVWRFDFSEGAAPGSVRVLAGDALEVNDNAVVFRLGGTTGERVSFVFRPRD